MAIDFPAAPTIGQVFVVGSVTYTWDGTKWKSNATNSPFSLGSASTPSITFIGDSNTGIYSPGADQVSVTTGGTERFRFDATGQFESVSLGTAAAPAFSFTTDPDTGLYSPGANQVAISTGGSERFLIGSAGSILSQGGPWNFSRYGGASANLVVNGFDGTQAAPTAVATSRSIGGVQGTAYDGTAGRQIGGIALWAEAAPTSTSSPGFISLTTTPAGSTLPTERLRITSAGLVGIGTSAPGQQLSITTASNDDGIVLTNSSANGGRVRLNSTGTGGRAYHIISTADGSGLAGGKFVITDNTASDAARFVIDSSGRVGIGTTSPVTVLDIVTGSNRGYFDDSSGSLFRLNAVNSINNAYAPLSINGSILTFQISASERARIDSSGRLLVGTFSAYNQSISGNTGYFAKTYFDSASAADGVGIGASCWFSNTTLDALGGTPLLLRRAKSGAVGTHTGGSLSNGDGISSVYFLASDGTSFVEAARIGAYVDGIPGTNDMPGRLVFSTTADGSSSPTERMRIDNAGRVSIATTANNGFNLSVSGASSAQFGDAADQSYGAVQIARPADQPDNKFHLCFIRSQQKAAGMGFLDNSSTFAIQNTDNNTGNGVTLTNGATSWGTTSDERKKRITANIETGLDKISDWRCVYFSYLNEPEEVVRVGLIAQDVQQTLPEAVSVEEDEIGTLQLKYTELIPVLVKALQESKQRIETLEARVAALESA